MRELTLEEIRRDHGGRLPPDAVLAADRPAGPPPATGHRSLTRRTRAGDRFALLNAFTDLAMAGLTRGELAVWLCLFRDTRPNGLARTGRAELARRTGCHPDTVKRAVAGLVAKKLLTVVRRGGPGRLALYRLRAPRW